MFTQELTVCCLISRAARKGISDNETAVKEEGLFQHMVVKVKNSITRGRNKIEMCSTRWLSFLLRVARSRPVSSDFCFFVLCFAFFPLPRMGQGIQPTLLNRWTKTSDCLLGTKNPRAWLLSLSIFLSLGRCNDKLTPRKLTFPKYLDTCASCDEGTFGLGEFVYCSYHHTLIPH